MCPAFGWLPPSISASSFASARALGATRERTCLPAEVGDELPDWMLSANVETDLVQSQRLPDVDLGRRQQLAKVA